MICFILILFLINSSIWQINSLYFSFKTWKATISSFSFRNYDRQKTSYWVLILLDGRTKTYFQMEVRNVSLESHAGAVWQNDAMDTSFRCYGDGSSAYMSKK